jgi:hypothetical protein
LIGATNLPHFRTDVPPLSPSLLSLSPPRAAATGRGRGRRERVRARARERERERGRGRETRGAREEKRREERVDFDFGKRVRELGRFLPPSLSIYLSLSLSPSPSTGWLVDGVAAAPTLPGRKRRRRRWRRREE